MDNMKLWDSVCITDKANTKEVTFGRRFTAICAYSQIEIATRLWGAFGSRWGVANENYSMIENRMALYSALLYYPSDDTEDKKGKVQIHSDIEIIFSDGKRKGKYNEDWTKKVATDALTKGLSLLGFNADVFLGKFGDNKYVSKNTESTKPITDIEKIKTEIWGIIIGYDDEQKEAAIKRLKECDTIEKLEKEKEGLLADIIF